MHNASDDLMSDRSVETLPGITAMWLVTLVFGAYTATHASQMSMVNWIALAGMVGSVGSITAIWWWNDE